MGRISVVYPVTDQKSDHGSRNRIRELAPKQAAMLFSLMSALKRITDSSQTSRQVTTILPFVSTSCAQKPRRARPIQLTANIELSSAAALQAQDGLSARRNQ